MTLRLEFTFSNTWGYLTENGSWDGVIGQLDRKEIDIGGTTTVILKARWDAVDYVAVSVPQR